MTADATAVSAEVTESEKGPSPMLRGWREGVGTTVLLFAHEPGSKTHGHGFINDGSGNRNVIFFFNDHDGKKSITLREFIAGEGGAHGKWSVVGFGNAMNQRKDGKPTYFDTVLFNIGDQRLKAYITKAGEQFRDQIGFTAARIERPKEDSNTQGADDAESADASQHPVERPRG